MPTTPQPSLCTSANSAFLPPLAVSCNAALPQVCSLLLSSSWPELSLAWSVTALWVQCRVLGNSRKASEKTWLQQVPSPLLFCQDASCPGTWGSGFTLLEMSPGAPTSRWQCWLDTFRDAGGGQAQLSSGLVRNGVISWTSVQDGGPGNLKAERTVLPYVSGALPCSASAGCPVGRLTGRRSVDSRLPEGQDGRGVLMGGTGRGGQETSVCCPAVGHGPPDGPLTHRRQTSDHLNPA